MEIDKSISSTDSTDLISLMISNSSSFTKVEDIEGYLENANSLENLPILPIYGVIKTLSPKDIAEILPKLAPEQRTAMLDIDIWEKDSISINKYSLWLEAYIGVKDYELKLEFALSIQFLLFLKLRLNYWTFDVENPLYPDHDYYFLTEDGLLLFEYDEDFEYVNEVKDFIKIIYAEFGVEKAYILLFKCLVDSHSLMEEEEYNLKKERLRDYGIVDYYDSLEMHQAYSSIKSLKEFINTRLGSTGDLQNFSKQQLPIHDSLLPFGEGIDLLKAEVQKVKSQKRVDFLNFDFLRLVNATLCYSNAFGKGKKEFFKIGNQTKCVINLGLSYLLENANYNNINLSLLEKFNFIDLFKIGNSLFKISQRKITTGLMKTSFNNTDAKPFLGMYLIDFFEKSFFKTPRMKNDKVIDCLDDYKEWEKNIDFCLNLLPFIDKFYETFKLMADNGELQNHFYINYDINEIDFEVILISLFVNFSLGLYDDDGFKRLGVSVGNLVKFYKMITFFNNQTSNFEVKDRSDSLIENLIYSFSIRFAFNKILNFDSYLYHLLHSYLDGYDIDSLKDDEFKHIGGPLIFCIGN